MFSIATSPVSRRIPHGIIRGPQTDYRQLALGGVPFYVRTGKRLAKRHTEITIQFKRAPFELFRNAPVRQTDGEPTGDSDPAGRRHLVQLRRQDSWAAAQAWYRRDEFRVCQVFRYRSLHRLRSAALRLHDRRRDAVPAFGHGRSRLDHCRSSSRRLERPAPRSFPAA